MSDIQFKFRDEAKTVFFKPSANIIYYDDKDAPKLLRRVPKRPQQKPEPRRRDDAANPATQD